MERAHHRRVKDEEILAGFASLHQAMLVGFEAIAKRFDDVDRRAAAFEHRMLRRFDALEARVGALEARVDALEARMDERFDGMDERFDRMDERFDRMDERLDRMDVRFERVEFRLIVLEPPR